MNYKTGEIVIVRWKIFTIETALIKERRGKLSVNDLKAIKNGFSSIFSF